MMIPLVADGATHCDPLRGPLVVAACPSVLDGMLKADGPHSVETVCGCDFFSAGFTKGSGSEKRPVVSANVLKGVGPINLSTGVAIGGIRIGRCRAVHPYLTTSCGLRGKSILRSEPLCAGRWLQGIHSVSVLNFES
jgi:hypothetical protein